VRGRARAQDLRPRSSTSVCADRAITAREPNLPIVRFELELDIDRPPEVVFALLTDVRRIPDWQASSVRAEADGPLREGARLRETRRFLGREFRTEMEVTGYTPPHRFDVESVHAPLPLAIRHTVELSGAGSRLGVVAEARVSGFKRFAAAAAAKTAEAEFRRDFQKLKELLEAS
jgi:uncharacterized protein YndB with AHSA1/START domain